jgi:hypothetical protein
MLKNRLRPNPFSFPYFRIKVKKIEFTFHSHFAGTEPFVFENGSAFLYIYNNLYELICHNIVAGVKN